MNKTVKRTIASSSTITSGAYSNLSSYDSRDSHSIDSDSDIIDVDNYKSSNSAERNSNKLISAVARKLPSPPMHAHVDKTPQVSDDDNEFIPFKYNSTDDAELPGGNDNLQKEEVQLDNQGGTKSQVNL